MLDFSDLVASSLRDLNTPPWLPDLTGALADMGWGALGRDSGLTAHNYGTARVLAGDVAAPRHFAAYLPTFHDAGGRRQAIPVEVLPTDFSRRYEDAGVNFYTAEEITGTEVLSCLEDAIIVLKLVPTLLTTVVTLVKSLHVIRPESHDHDVSFSEPHIPFSIFVSTPRENSRAGALRVAEAVVHEAMHLQLTLVERVMPLVAPAGGKYFSPWRDEHRTAQGVLHALYVFRVIDKWLFELAASPHCPKMASAYARERRSELGTQFDVINSFGSCSEVTGAGAGFVRRLIEGG